MNVGVILPHAVYRRAQEPDQLPSDLRLVALEWALYFAAGGTDTAAELSRRMRVEAADRDAALARLLQLGLIEEQPLSASEYVRALAASGDREEKTLREFLLGAGGARAAQPGAPEAQQREAPQRPQLRDVSASLDDTQPARAPRPPRPVPVPFKPLPSAPVEGKEAQPMPAKSRKLSLRALMRVIESRAGNREAGQLDFYRVFIGVDTLLLKRSGIRTLRFTEDRLVSDPELEKAIVGSVKKTLGLDCPETVWVEVA